jgi:hypothetical protein
MKVEIPKWDGKRGRYPQYCFKTKALAVIQKCSDALNESKMVNCPTQAKYDDLDQTSTTPDVIEKISLWKQNDMLAGYIALGQDGLDGIDVIEETISKDFPMGVPYLFFKKLDWLFKPKDLSSEIVMKLEV